MPKQNLSLAQQCSSSGGLPESFQESDIINSTHSSQDYDSESSSKTLRCISVKCLKLEFGGRREEQQLQFLHASTTSSVPLAVLLANKEEPLCPGL